MASSGVYAGHGQRRVTWCAYCSFGSGKTRKFFRGFGATEKEAIQGRETLFEKRIRDGNLTPQGEVTPQSQGKKLSAYIDEWLASYSRGGPARARQPVGAVAEQGH